MLASAYFAPRYFAGHYFPAVGAAAAEAAPFTPAARTRILWARGRATRYMLDSGVIVRPNLLDDGAGSTYPDPSGPTRIGPILGTFTQLSGDELVIAAQLGQQGRYRWAVPVGTVIRETDQIELLGWAYQVVWVPPVAALDPARVVGLEEAYQLATIDAGAITDADGQAITDADGQAVTDT